MIKAPMCFNFDQVKMNLGSKQKPAWYLEVKYRLMWFRESCEQGTIETKLLHLDTETEYSEDIMEWSDAQRKKIKIGTKTAKGYAVVASTITDGQGNSATGMKMEKAVSFPDFLEKAETGAIGRALAALGYGTGQAGQELDTRIVDAPFQAAASEPTEDQVRRLGALLRASGKRMTRPQSFAECEKLIAELQATA